jgi:hypothetical protein
MQLTGWLSTSMKELQNANDISQFEMRSNVLHSNTETYT